MLHKIFAVGRIFNFCKRQNIEQTIWASFRIACVDKFSPYLQ